MGAVPGAGIDRLPARVLVVDDDATVAEVVVAYLGRAGFVADQARDAVTALAHFRASRPDLVVLDLMLPDGDGLELCRLLRSELPGLPVIMLTARGDEEDRLVGLEVGADDYVTKPFSPRELVLRVQSVLRRSGHFRVQGHENESIVDGTLRIDVVAHRAFRDGAELGLTGREFDLLAFLMSHPRRAFSRDDLMLQVWGWDFGDRSTVTVHVRRLREKLEVDPSRPVRLVTVWGVGYRWDPDDGT
jgi:two-component system response regulator ResD